MPVQPNYNTTIDPFYEGMVQTQEHSERATVIPEDVAGLAFGKACFQGAADQGVVVAPSAKFVGIAIRTPAREVTDGDIYVKGKNAAALLKGVIVVRAAVAVAARDQCYVTPAGTFTNVSNGGANFLIPAYFGNAVAGGALTPLRVRIG